MSEMTVTVVLEDLRCGECNIIFAIDKRHHKELQASGQKFYCPNGHHIGYKVAKKPEKAPETQEEVFAAMAERLKAPEKK